MGAAAQVAKHGQGFSNTCLLHRVALKQLRKLPYIAVKNDKLPGFSFIHQDEITHLEQLALPESKYVPIFASQINVPELQQRVGSLAKRIQMREPNHQVSPMICRSLSGAIACQLGYTIKTHKAVNDVVPRTLHLARFPMLHGVSAWIVWKLDRYIRGLPHLMRDSVQFKRAVHGLSLPSTAKLIAIDLKDLFLSGPGALKDVQAIAAAADLSGTR